MTRIESAGLRGVITEQATLDVKPGREAEFYDRFPTVEHFSLVARA